MRQLIDQIRQKSGSSAVLLASTESDTKVTLVAGVSKDLQENGGLMRGIGSAPSRKLWEEGAAEDPTWPRRVASNRNI